MHQLIRVLTTGYEPESSARAVRTNLFESQHAHLIGPFDYGRLMNEGGRWSTQLPEPVQATGAIRADTDEGMTLVEGAWVDQTKALKRFYDVIQAGFERGMDFEDVLNDATIEDVAVEPYNPMGLAEDEEDYNDTYTSNIRYAMHQIGRYRGPDIYLYDEDGSGIRRPDDYETFIECIENNEGRYRELNDGERWYVIPIDVHY